MIVAMTGQCFWRFPRLPGQCSWLFTAGKTVSEIGLELDEDHGVLSRVGLHCAPSAHRTVGSFPEGTVRLAPGVFTSPDDIHPVISSVARVAIS